MWSLIKWALSNGICENRSGPFPASPQKKKKKEKKYINQTAEGQGENSSWLHVQIYCTFTDVLIDLTGGSFLLKGSHLLLSGRDEYVHA